MSGNEFRFFLSCDINLPVTFRVEGLEGYLPPKKSPNPDIDNLAEERKAEIYVECALYIDGAPFGLPTRTRLESAGPPYCWNELITLSTKYRDLTAHSQLALTVWDVSCGKEEGLIGGATILLFSSKKQLKTGKQKLRLWHEKEADGSFPTATPGKVPRDERGELERLEKLLNKYERGQIQRVDWLDRLSFKSIEKVKERESNRVGLSNQYYTRFKTYCCEAYNILRKSSNLILNLFHLMAGSNIPDIACDPEKSILKLQEKFNLELDDEACIHFFQGLITDSVNALFPQMVETIHRWAQYWR